MKRFAVGLRYTTVMSQAQKIHCYSLEEYLAFVHESEVRHEYLDGEIVAID